MQEVREWQQYCESECEKAAAVTDTLTSITRANTKANANISSKIDENHDKEAKVEDVNIALRDITITPSTSVKISTAVTTNSPPPSTPRTKAVTTTANTDDIDRGNNNDHNKDKEKLPGAQCVKLASPCSPDNNIAVEAAISDTSFSPPVKKRQFRLDANGRPRLILPPPAWNLPKTTPTTTTSTTSALPHAPNNNAKTQQSAASSSSSTNQLRFEKRAVISMAKRGIEKKGGISLAVAQAREMGYVFRDARRYV